jgi:hypothetical protein
MPSARTQEYSSSLIQILIMSVSQQVMTLSDATSHRMLKDLLQITQVCQRWYSIPNQEP